MSDNFYTDNADLRFYVERAVDWDGLWELAEHGYKGDEKADSAADAREMYEGILDEFGRFVARKVDPFAREIDEEGCELVDGEVKEGPAFAKVFKAMKRLDVYGLPIPRELGGLNAPASLYMATAEMMARADVSTMTHYGFHVGVSAALVMYAYRDPRSKIVDGRLLETPYDDAIAEMCSGKTWGCMVLTEPGAGSDLGAIRATAELDDHGTWRINGEKIWITSGHGQWQLVLARTEDPDVTPGLKGLSLFLVRRQLKKGKETVDNVRIAKVEHKIGHHGSPTCSLVYEDSEGVLVGERGEGFYLMTVMMNFARMAVGFEGLGICERAYREALAFAEERVTMGKSITRHEMIADFLEDMDLQVKGLRALNFYATEVVEKSQFLEIIAKHDPPSDHEERAALNARMKKLKREARHLTPVVKYAASEQAVALSRLAMQILGGSGYVTEYLPEKLLRDALVLPIYEGTSQIQSLMALKDRLMAAMKNPRRFVAKMARARFTSVTHKDPMEKALARMQVHQFGAMQTILMKIAGGRLRQAYGRPVSDWADVLGGQWDPKTDFGPGLLHAERLMRILCEVETARALVKVARRFPERREIALAYMRRADIKCRQILIEIEEHGDELLERLHSEEGAADVTAAAA
jgi:alkylation response protein AidB-like acyl-CoA dehydrogenase